MFEAEANQERKMNSKKNRPMSAGIETPFDDENQFDRRHFHNSTSSDIFFCGLAENDAHRGSQKENFIPESNADEDNSCIIAESEINGKESETYDDKKKFERRHFCNCSSSDIFSTGLPANDMQHGDQKENFIIPESNADEDNSCIIAESEINGKESEQEKFYESSDNVTPAENADQVDSAEITERLCAGRQNADEKNDKTQKRHFFDRNTSDIFFRNAEQE